jgi:hypothetical protein
MLRLHISCRRLEKSRRTVSAFSSCYCDEWYMFDSSMASVLCVRATLLAAQTLFCSAYPRAKLPTQAQITKDS